MRIQLILLLGFLSFNLMASDDKAIKDLFNKYDLIMDHKKIELIDEVFTKSFIQNSGGKEELISKIKELPTPKEKSLPQSKLTWKKGQKGDIYLATLEETSKLKNKKHSEKAEFVVLKEEGKLKINGTISDGE